MSTPQIDWATLTDVEVEAIRSAAADELGRRQQAHRAESVMDGLIRDQLADLGREPGDPWVQPTHALDAYPTGWVVAHDGHRWESLIFANITTPGSDDRWWRDLGPTDEPDPEEPPDPGADPGPWVAGTAYVVGDLVTHDGQTWRCVLAHTSHAGIPPSIYTHAYWTPED